MTSRYSGCDCFWVEPTGRARLSLRRFYFAPSENGSMPAYRYRACPESEWGCDATVTLDDYVWARFRTDGDFGKVLLTVPRSQRPRASDPRWPTACSACSRPFDRHAVRQVNQSLEYERADGTLLTMKGHHSPEHAGALYDLWWRGFDRNPAASDDLDVTAVCPDGTHWHIDHRASSGGYWTRTGDPRDPESLTVSPSIQTGAYHGFLQSGRFTDDLGS